MLEIMLQSYYIFLYDFSFCKIAVLYLGAFPAVLFTFLVKTGQNRSKTIRCTILRFLNIVCIAKNNYFCTSVRNQ